MAKAIGFTGVSSHADTGVTRGTSDRLLQLRDEGFDEFHHGDCVGADQAAHRRAVRAGFRIVIHPPLDESRRAFCIGRNVTVLDPGPYLKRNANIVAASEYLIAMVADPAQEVLRSGEWATVRYARKANKYVELICAI